VLAQVIGVGAVDDHGTPAAGHLVEARPQLRLAEVAPVRCIAQVIGVAELVGVELEERHPEARGQVASGAPLRHRVRGAASDHGEKVFRAESLGPCYREQG
jgi:hypothetical protein